MNGEMWKSWISILQLLGIRNNLGRKQCRYIKYCKTILRLSDKKKQTEKYLNFVFLKRKIFYTKEIDYKLHDLRNNHKNVALKLADGCDSFTLAAVVKINVYLLIQIWRRKKWRNEKKIATSFYSKPIHFTTFSVASFDYFVIRSFITFKKNFAYKFLRF